MHVYKVGFALKLWYFSFVSKREDKFVEKCRISSRFAIVVSQNLIPLPKDLRLAMHPQFWA